MTENATEATEKTSGKKAEQKTRPMGVQEKRDLAKLIDNDFQALRNEMEVFAGELERNRLQEIEAQYAEREEQAREAMAEWREIRQRCYDMVDEFKNRWQDRGFRMTSQSPDRLRRGYGEEVRMIAMADHIYALVPEKETALNNVQNDVRHQMQKAKTDLERSRITLQRQLLLTGLISEEAQKLLAQMPDPRGLLINAIQASGNRGLLAIDAVAVQQVEAPPPVQVVDEGVHIPEVVE